MSAWIVILAVGAGTYLLRISMFMVVGRRSLPTWTITPMAYVGPAAIAALVGSMLLTANGSIAVVRLPELAAVAVGFATVRRTGNVMHAFATGMPAFWLLSPIVGF
jgi:branched-subunit amino acid transport protein